MLEALTANPAVWSRTVLVVNFDENDGFFDHVPPPAPPSASSDPAVLAGASTVDTAGEYHEVLPIGVDPTKIALHNRGVEPIELVLRANAYTSEEHVVVVPAGQDRVRRWSLERSAHWYDITVEARGLPGFRRRFAGRVETGRHSLSDPAMGGPARGEPM